MCYFTVMAMSQDFVSLCTTDNASIASLEMCANTFVIKWLFLFSSVKWTWQYKLIFIVVKIKIYNITVTFRPLVVHPFRKLFLIYDKIGLRITDRDVKSTKWEKNSRKV